MRLSVAVTAVCLSLVALSVADEARASIRKPTSISPQGLGVALQELARDRDLQVLYRTEIVGTTRTAGAAGELTIDEALTSLLSGTGLTFKYLDDKTVTIVPAAPAAPASRPREPQSDARETPAPTPKLEEVVVTAQKREQRLLDVPISVAAMGATELEQRRITNLDELAGTVPSLSVISTGGYSRQIALRGVANQFGTSNLFAMYLDEASLTSATTYAQPDVQTYDLERVEVLRGPQGTLYGEGAVGGTVRFITKNPVLDQVQANASLAASFTEDGGPGQKIDAMVNVPLIRDQLGIRIAGGFDHAGGWIDQPAAGRDDFNDQRLTNVRVKGLWRPTTNLSVNAMAVIYRNSTSINAGEDENGNFTQDFHLTTTPDVQDDYNLSNLTLTYDFGGARLLSTTSYFDQDKLILYSGRKFQASAPPAPPFDVYIERFPIESKIFTEELRLTSTSQSALQWTLGSIYRRARGTIPDEVSYFGAPGPVGTPLPAPFFFQQDNLSKSWAVFGDGSYTLTDRLTLGAGLRYFKDDQTFTSGPVQTGQFHATNPRFYGQYKLSEQASVYASASKGFRSGGFNALSQPAFEPESLWSYELGNKLALADGRIRLDTAVFYSRYGGYQIYGFVPLPNAGPVGITSNAGQAKIQGGEWLLVWQPSRDWTLNFGGSYVDSEFTRITSSNSSYIEGDPIDGFPKYSYTLSAQRAFRLGARPSFVRLDYTEQDHLTYRNRSLGSWYFSESAILNMLNLHASVQWTDTLSVGVFGQNLLNDRGYVGVAAIEGFAGRSRPRTYGLQLAMTFE